MDRWKVDTLVPQNCGYIVWKDRSTVTFWSNDLNATSHVLFRAHKEASTPCVHKLVKIRRWLVYEAMDSTVIEVATNVLAYTLFKNGEDRFNCLSSSPFKKQKKLRVKVSIFTFLLYSSVQNALALYKSLAEHKDHKFHLCIFKRHSAECMMPPMLVYNSLFTPGPFLSVWEQAAL